MISIVNTSRLITSPGYPADYTLGLRCKWIVKAPHGHDVHIHFVDVDMEDSESCAGDRLQIVDQMVVSFVMIVAFIRLIFHLFYVFLSILEQSPYKSRFRRRFCLQRKK